MTRPLSYDIFCRVVDNYGDIGVCWRLARQLAHEHGAPVRLWVDDLAALRLLCAQVDEGRADQRAAGVEILRWDRDFPYTVPADVAVEAFGCGLPERYVEALAARGAPALWIVLEYLSAERWVPEHHGLPSPHPRLPLRRYFFFPGFVAGTGGVLREAGLPAGCAAGDTAGRDALWAATGFAPAPAQATVVSLFSYAHAPLDALLDAWAQSGTPLVAAVAPGPAAAAALAFLGERAPAQGRVLRRGSLEVRMLPFVEQPRYDALLRACDCNFVRGEDSFVRAQWALRPFVWHIYPQQDGAHWRKLEAFLDLYCAGLPPAAGEAVREFWRGWNQGPDARSSCAAAWREFWRWRAVLDAHAQHWAERVAAVGDMAGKLAQFCQDRIK